MTTDASLVRLARDFGRELWETRGVKRNTLLSLVASFEDDREELVKVLKGLQDGSGGHRDRGRGYEDQVVAAAEGLLDFLDGHPLAGKELRTIFGWTARELLIQEQFGKKPQKSTTPSKAGRNTPPKTARERKPLGSGLGSKNLSELEALKKKIENQD